MVPIKSHALALSAFVVTLDNAEAEVLRKVAAGMGRTVHDVIPLIVERGLLEYRGEQVLRSKPHDLEGKD